MISDDRATAESIVQRAAAATFGRALITNVYRGVIAEAIVDAALSPTWKWCSADYASWDFEHPDGTRLEVKQSAARQTWATATSPPSRASFDIAERTGFYEDRVTWVERRGRAADLYVFCYHPIADLSADHRDPDQWEFYIVPTSELAPTKRISLRSVQDRGRRSSFETLSSAVELTRVQRSTSGDRLAPNERA